MGNAVVWLAIYNEGGKQMPHPSSPLMLRHLLPRSGILLVRP